MSGTRKRRVAILGGGQAALTTALQLTDPANPRRDELEVTVYQLGWRLGGKGATGRPKDEPWKHDRIEEHGLHNWFGFYDNSFAQIRRVYAELDRPAGAPLATFEEAFEPANEAVFVERIEGRPRLWTIENMTNDAKPGEGGLWLEPWAYVEMALESVERMLTRSRLAAFGRGHPALAEVDERLGGHASTESGGDLLRVARDLARRARERRLEPKGHHPLAHLLDRIGQELERTPRLPFERFAHEVEDVTARALCWALSLFTTLLWDAVRHDIETAAKDEERRVWIPANLAYACIVGAVRDGILDRGFDVVNELDFREWIAKYAHDDGGVMLRSPMVEAIYTASFAYRAGDASVRRGGTYALAEDMEAGTTLRGFVRTLFGYKGAFAYRFRAGTADTCYAPAYEVLKRRGVKFAFFHRVDRLDVDDGRVVRIVLCEQAQLADGSYEPLYPVDGLPCWPSTPHWEQLADGEWFRSVGANFECPSPEVRRRERELPALEVGRDFDDVVLGISLAALPSICGGLIERSPAWADAVRHVQTVRTQALQLWLTRTGRELGFTIEGRPIVTWLYDRESPLNVWGDFSELIPMEGWTAACHPDLLGYFCSTMPDAGADPFDPFPDQAAADQRVRENVLELLRKGIATLLPDAVEGGDFDWSLLLDARPLPGTGPERLDSQYFRANVTPTERYVLSVKGSSKYRLPVHDPDEVANLYLAGDWTQCTLNVGCMEAATMSGLLCANALCGYPPREGIVGVDF